MTAIFSDVYKRQPQCHRPTPLGQCQEIADQMRPAQLVPFGWLFQVGASPIRPNNAAILRTNQAVQHCGAPSGRDQKQRRHRSHHRPQPPALARFFPASLINIDDGRGLHLGLKVIVDRCQGRTDGRLARHDTCLLYTSRTMKWVWVTGSWDKGYTIRLTMWPNNCAKKPAGNWFSTTQLIDLAIFFS